MKEKEFLPNIKEKLGIEELNEMQKMMLEKGSSEKNIILLSPTGSGKTLAFILPLLKFLKEPSGRIQAAIIAPSRELVMQISGVIKKIASGYRVVEVYGGHKVEDETNSLKVIPDIIVATPGRLLDHSERHNLELLPVRILVLDEFDKSLELGFEDEMKKLVKRMKNVSRYILTSATDTDVLPEFLNIENPITFNFLSENKELKTRMNINKVDAGAKDKLESLLTLLHNISDKNGNGIEKTIIFANHRESAERIANFLKKNKVDAILYHGNLDQRERETALAIFNSDSRPVLVATDLAARGLDIENVKSIIHYHLPPTEEVYVHRNGRTARIEESGDVYLLVGPDEELKEYINPDNDFILDETKKGNLSSGKSVIYINAGKREKLSKGDILGFLIKECGLENSQIGKINVFDHYSLVTIDRNVTKSLLEKAEKKKIKGERRKFSVI